MRKKNRIAALLVAAVLTLSLAACGGSGGEQPGSDPAGAPASDKDPLEAAMENMAAAKSMDASMTMDMEMSVADQSVTSVISMDMTMFTEPAMRMKADMTVDAGEQGSTTMAVYAEAQDDGTYMMYLNDGTNWYSQPASAEDLGQYELNESLTGYVDSTTGFTQTGTETVDGVSAYKYTGVISGDQMKDVMSESGALNSLSSLGLDESQTAELLDGLGDIQVTMWISESELYPVRYEMDMTAVMDGLMQAVVTSMGDQAEGITMTVPKMLVTMTCSNFNNATEFSVPDEAKN